MSLIISMIMADSGGIVPDIAAVVLLMLVPHHSRSIWLMRAIPPNAVGVAEDRWQTGRYAYSECIFDD